MMYSVYNITVGMGGKKTSRYSLVVLRSTYYITEVTVDNISTARVRR